jgi:plasmid stabilization system protein ParE
MKLRLAVLQEAETEFKEAISWYAKQKKGLGTRFAKAVRAKFKSIQKTPTMHAVVMDDVRKATIRDFPYVIPYIVTSEEIVIIAVFHAKRDPKEWQSRVE